jgi:hypothetical protein
MANRSARVSRRRPAFDSLEVRSLLTADPFGVVPIAGIAVASAANAGALTAKVGSPFAEDIGPLASASAPFADGVAPLAIGAGPLVKLAGPFASVSIDVSIDGLALFRTSFGPGENSPDPSAFVSQRGVSTNDAPGLELDHAAIGPSPLFSSVAAEHREQVEPAASLAIQQAGFGHESVSALVEFEPPDRTGPSAPDQSADSIMAPPYVFFALRTDFEAATGGPAGSMTLAGPPPGASPRGKIESMVPDASSPLDLGGVNDPNATAVQAALPANGKSAETAVGTAPSAVIPAAAGALPFQLTSLFSLDSSKGVAPASEVAAAVGAEHASGISTSGAARMGVGRATSSRILASSSADANLTVGFGGDMADALPRPMGADLIGEFLPFQRTSLDRVVNRFFEQFDDVDVRAFVEHNPAHIVFLSLTLTSTVVALDLARRRWRKQSVLTADVRVRDPRASRDHLGFPELPGSWSSRLT